jgi:pimeloyl-ACP methyl ester carboxylesterase
MRFSQGSRKWLWRLIGGLGALGLAVATVAALLEARTVRRLTERHEPPGRMIELGSHALHLYCTGEGHPAVVLIAGSGLAYVNWESMQGALQSTTQVCSYDRSGLGWSEAGPGDPSANRATEELRELLIAAEVPGPWIIVGHSLGGLYAQQFMNLYGGDVAALVLLDTPHELYFDRFPEFLERYTPTLWQSFELVLSHFGFQRLGRPKVPESDPSWVARQLHATPKHVQAAAREWWSIPLSTKQVREARRSWGDVPLLVFEAGRIPWPSDWPPAEVAEAKRKRTALQHELAERSSRGEYRLLEESGHGIPWEYPEPVVAAIDSIVSDLRSVR